MRMHKPIQRFLALQIGIANEIQIGAQASCRAGERAGFGGFAGLYMVGFLTDRTGTYVAGALLRTYKSAFCHPSYA